MGDVEKKDEQKKRKREKAGRMNVYVKSLNLTIYISHWFYRSW